MVRACAYERHCLPRQLPLPPAEGPANIARELTPGDVAALLCGALAPDACQLRHDERPRAREPQVKSPGRDGTGRAP
eukprot:scaffold5698_cov161-Prasinococcus_capsulatus_cf.AAC.1